MMMTKILANLARGDPTMASAAEIGTVACCVVCPIRYQCRAAMCIGECMRSCVALHVHAVCVCALRQILIY